MAVLLLEVVIYVAAAFILYALALERRAVFYSLIGTVASLWSLAQVANSGNPPAVTVAVAWDSTLAAYQSFNLGTSDWQSLLVFQALVVVIGAMITMDLSMARGRKE